MLVTARPEVGRAPPWSGTVTVTVRPFATIFGACAVIGGVFDPSEGSFETLVTASVAGLSFCALSVAPFTT